MTNGAMMKIEPSQNEQADLKRRLHEAAGQTEAPFALKATPYRWPDPASLPTRQ